jgi:antitoxin (DNA-binding transcriptional repressor) of toxin-antitoxin stability system
MKTLSPTEARANMTRWLDQAISGHSIGITHKGRIIKLQPVPVTEDWAVDEYGLTAAEIHRASESLLRKGKDLLESGQTIAWEQFKKRRKT